MPDQFDIQRKLDHQSDEVADEAVDRLDDARDEKLLRDARLVKLDQAHYFDPKHHLILEKTPEGYKNLGHDAALLQEAAEKTEESARRKGYLPLAGGLFWDAAGKQLYVKNQDRYVLYAQDRRKAGDREGL